MAYITKEELTNSGVGFDFAKYDEGTFLDELIEVGQDILNDYLGRDFSTGPFTEKSESLVDKMGRILVQTRNYPIDEVTALSVSASGTSVSLDVTQLDLFEDQGYMYYETSSEATGYPSSIIASSTNVAVEITYTVKPDSTPNAVKRALILVCANLLKDEEMFQQVGISANLGVSAFKSGNYSVTFKDPEKIGETVSDTIVPKIAKALVSRYKRVGQNIS